MSKKSKKSKKKLSTEKLISLVMQEVTEYHNTVLSKASSANTATAVALSSFVCGVFTGRGTLAKYKIKEKTLIAALDQVMLSIDAADKLVSKMPGGLRDSATDGETKH